MCISSILRKAIRKLETRKDITQLIECYIVFIKILT